MTVAGAAIFFAAAGYALAGWHGGLPILLHRPFGDAPVPYATAIGGFALCGAALLALATGRMRAVALAGAALAGLAALALVEALGGFELGVARLGPAGARYPPPAMRSVAALGFLFAGSAGVGAVLWDRQGGDSRDKRWRGGALVGVAVGWVVGIASLALLRHGATFFALLLVVAAALGALVTHLLGLARAHSEALEERSRELELSNRDLKDFAHAASHDLKAPLRAIDNLARWIAEDAAEFLPDESRKHLEQLQGRVQRLSRLLDDMLEYARAGQLRAASEAVDTGELVSGIVELLAPRPTLCFEIEPAMPVVHAARAPLEQVFRNLISNAIKHHDRLEGSVRISHRDLPAHVEFAVSDDGPGIEAKHHERVFQMFQALRPRDAVEGSGVGLALVRRLVHANGGSVELESAGRGATFRFRWPKEAPP